MNDKFCLLMLWFFVIINKLPPGGRGNLRIVPSVSLHAVKGSEWIMWVWYWEAAHLCLFPTERLGLLVEGTTCSIIDNMQALVVSGRATGLMFHCHITFFLKVCQTHATCTNPTELDFAKHKENWIKTIMMMMTYDILMDGSNALSRENCGRHMKRTLND